MKSDSETAIDTLMEHAPALYGYAYSRVGDHHMAEDLVQESLVAAWKSWSQFQGGSSVLTWLTGILRHKMLDHHRATARKLTVSLDEREDRNRSMENLFDKNGNWRIDPNHGTSPLMESPAKAAQNADLRRWIEICMEKLPARLHMLFVAREIDELPVAESAKLAGVTSGSAAVLLTRARQALRLCLQEALNR